MAQTLAPADPLVFLLKSWFQVVHFVNLAFTSYSHTSSQFASWIDHFRMAQFLWIFSSQSFMLNSLFEVTFVVSFWSWALPDAHVLLYTRDPVGAWYTTTTHRVASISVTEPRGLVFQRGGESLLYKVPLFQQEQSSL